MSSSKKIGLGSSALKTRNWMKFPERLKGGILEKWANYWVNVAKDYQQVGIDVINETRMKPFKVGTYVAGIAGVVYAIKTNPDEKDFRNCLQNYMNDSGLLGSKIRNPYVDNHLNYLVECFNHDLLRRISIGCVSFLWVDNYSTACGAFKANCSYLQPRYLTFHERIVDVGFLGKWWVLSHKMEEFDVNPDEWKEEPKENSSS